MSNLRVGCVGRNQTFRTAPAEGRFCPPPNRGLFSFRNFPFTPPPHINLFPDRTKPKGDLGSTWLGFCGPGGFENLITSGTVPYQRGLFVNPIAALEFPSQASNWPLNWDCEHPPECCIDPSFPAYHPFPFAMEIGKIAFFETGRPLNLDKVRYVSRPREILPRLHRKLFASFRSSNCISSQTLGHDFPQFDLVHS